MEQLENFEGQLIHQTDGAYLIDLDVHDEGEEGTWIPKILCQDVEELEKEITSNGAKIKVDWITFDLPEKIALEKGLI